MASRVPVGFPGEFHLALGGGGVGVKDLEGVASG